MTTPEIVCTEFTNEDSAAALAEGFDNVDALRSGHLGGAALDAFAKEPLSGVPGARYRGTPNRIATPHIAGISIESSVRGGETAADIVRVALGGSPTS